MRDKYGAQNDIYCYPDSSVLINRLSITDPHELEIAEIEFSMARAEEYEPSFNCFDLPHLKNIHFHLFQDMFDWAGELRRVDISKGQARFCNINYIEKEANKLFLQLKEGNYLRSLSREDFVVQAAEYYCELNVIHPFRDGNGRAQRLFFEELAINAEYQFSWSSIGQEEWLNANIAGYRGDLSPLTDLLDSITTPL